MTREQAIQKVAELIRGIKFCMLVTQTDEGHLHSRPVTTQDQEFDGDLWFIGGKDSEWVQDISKREQINLAYSQPDGQNYVSITGRASLVEDRTKLEEVWSDFYKAYFPEGIDDPNVQLVRVETHGAELWESSGKLASAFQTAKGLLTGNQADMGTNQSVALE
ncbi:general stress protein [Deinococcus radiophilus]|uniref:General stress protein n=1 Tax=Deinococcus radiophilus TaxID=32062 RepID=A0A3S0IP37_9DEIO|nr:general stress protein [Deinococcus radiophilus]